MWIFKICIKRFPWSVLYIRYTCLSAIVCGCEIPTDWISAYEQKGMVSDVGVDDNTSAIIIIMRQFCKCANILSVSFFFLSISSYVCALFEPFPLICRLQYRTRFSIFHVQPLTQLYTHTVTHFYAMSILTVETYWFKFVCSFGSYNLQNIRE